MHRKKRALILLEIESDDEDEVLLSCILKKRKSTHLSILRRETEGVYNTFIRKYCFSNPQLFKKYFRLSLDVFNDVLNVIRVDIESVACNRHINPISAEEKLCLTLR